LERETGVEPATSSLGSWHSTTELLPLGIVFKYLHETKGLNSPSRQSTLSTRFYLFGSQNGQHNGQHDRVRTPPSRARLHPSATHNNLTIPEHSRDCPGDLTAKVLSRRRSLRRPSPGLSVERAIRRGATALTRRGSGMGRRTDSEGFRDGVRECPPTGL
jgi:hypothetical protein